LKKEKKRKAIFFCKINLKMRRQLSSEWMGELKEDRLMRISVLHESTGVPVYDKVWRWRGNRDSDGFSKLVQTALNVGQSMKDSGGIRYVLMQPHAIASSPSGKSLATTALSANSASSTNASVSGAANSKAASRHNESLTSVSRRQPSSSRRRTQSSALDDPLRVSSHLVRLALCVGKGFVVAVFHGAGANWSDVDSLIDDVLESFARDHQARVDQLAAVLESIANEKKEALETLEDVLKKFSSFDRTLADACAHHNLICGSL
jgi:hypothetical protein